MMDEFLLNYKTFLRARKVSQETAAQQLGVNRCYLNKVLNGHYLPAGKLIKKMEKMMEEKNND